jgi:hypothetical protein
LHGNEWSLRIDSEVEPERNEVTEVSSGVIVASEKSAENRLELPGQRHAVAEGERDSTRLDESPKGKLKSPAG